METEIFERLAEIKATIKPLEKEAKELLAQLIEEGDMPQQVVTRAGKLCKSKRENWVTIDPQLLIKTMTQKLFIQGATITKAKIQKLGGQVLVDKLVDNKSLHLKSVSEYYMLKTS